MFPEKIDTLDALAEIVYWMSKYAETNEDQKEIKWGEYYTVHACKGLGISLPENDVDKVALIEEVAKRHVKLSKERNIVRNQVQG